MRRKRLELWGPHDTSDGRHIDPSIGHLSGEGSRIQVRAVQPDAPVAEPRKDIVAGDRSTYYGMPALKEPVWRWYIPAYFYSGGVAGTSAWIGLVAQLSGDRRLRRTVIRCRGMATAGLFASAAFLIADLGRPSRFYNMMRVFRPTSPMNLGTWILSAAGATNGLALVTGMLSPKRRLADGLSVLAGALGLPLAAYTSVLLANTAVPVWQHGRRSLPALFLASGLASAASLLELFPSSARERSLVRAWAIAGKAAAVGSELLLLADVRRHPEVARPLQQGASGALFHAARNLTVASLVLSVIGRRRSARRVAGALGTLGAMALRYALLLAGTASSRDPHATFAPQRRANAESEIGASRRSRQIGPAKEITVQPEGPVQTA